MNRSITSNKRALSPVIATVILVSVTIVVAVSVAYWMGTISSGYTAFEQIELPTTYATYATSFNGTDSYGGWKVNIELKNSGSADATIDNVFLNAKPLKDYASGTVALDPGTGTNQTTFTTISISVVKGTSKALNLFVQKYNPTDSSGVEGCTSGTRIDLKIHTAAGRDYPVQVKLP